MASDPSMESLEILSASDCDREASYEPITIRTDAFVQAGHDAETQENMLHVFGQPS